MRILHTSDWHLGRKLHGHDLHDHQEAAVHHIVDAAIEASVDAVLVSGDVFDGPVPPVASIKLLNAALTRLHDAGITSILTAGNHDQAERLSAYSNLLMDSVHIVGSSDRLASPVELADEHGPLLVYPITFLWPDDERNKLADDPTQPLARSHDAVTRVALERVRADLAAREEAHGSAIRTVVMSHAFVTRSGDGPSEAEVDEVACKSERDLSIGGVQTVPSALFDGFTYVALGHLHRPQQVTIPGDSSTVLRYSGSLLRYSTSEAKHEKSFLLVDIGAHGSIAEHETRAIPQGRGMAVLSDTLENLIDPAKYGQHFNDFVDLTFTDAERPDHAYAQLANAYPAILGQRHVPAGRSAERMNAAGPGHVAKRKEIDVLTDFVSKVWGKPATDEERAVLQGVLEQVRAAEVAQ